MAVFKKLYYFAGFFGFSEVSSFETAFLMFFKTLFECFLQNAFLTAHFDRFTRYSIPNPGRVLTVTPSWFRDCTDQSRRWYLFTRCAIYVQEENDTIIVLYDDLSY